MYNVDHGKGTIEILKKFETDPVARFRIREYVLEHGVCGIQSDQAFEDAIQDRLTVNRILKSVRTDPRSSYCVLPRKHSEPTIKMHEFSSPEEAADFLEQMLRDLGK